MDSSLILSITTFIYGLGAFLYESIQNLVTGQHTNIHQTMIAAEKSSVAFEFMMQIRNKTIAAYDKITNMPTHPVWFMKNGPSQTPRAMQDGFMLPGFA